MANKTTDGVKADRRSAHKGRVLGKGLSALIEGAGLSIARIEGREVREIPIDQLSFNPKQPRKVFHQDKLEELAASIKDVGMLQPILVRSCEQGDGQSGATGTDATGTAFTGALEGMSTPWMIRSEGSQAKIPEKYMVVAGERRVRAARLAGLTTVPALICSFEETEALRIALLENIQRENLGPIEEAVAYRDLQDTVGATQEELADMLGKNRSTVSNTLRLLTLEDELQALVEDGTLTRGHAKALLGLPAGQDRLRLARLCRSRGLSVREAERRVQGILAARQRSRRRGRSAARSEKTGDTPEIRALRSRAEEYFGSPVTIDRQEDGSGRISVDFYGDADLERLLSMMGLQTTLD